MVMRAKLLCRWRQQNWAVTSHGSDGMPNDGTSIMGRTGIVCTVILLRIKSEIKHP